MRFKRGFFKCFLPLCFLAVFTAFVALNVVERIQNLWKKRVIYTTCGEECIKVELGNSSHYLVQTEGCNILDFSPTHPDIARFTYKNVTELVCSKRLPLTEDSELTLLFFEDRIPLYGSSKKSLKCFYQGILRVTQSLNHFNIYRDYQFTLMAKKPINKRRTKINYDGILVTCYDQSRSSRFIYRKVHFFIQPERAKEKREKFKRTETRPRSHSEILNVIIMGTDTVSRGSMRRHMPLTFNYLTKNLQSIDLRGLNKVGDNTYPNIVALLMGLSQEEVEQHQCQNVSDPLSRLDLCPLIWKDFSQKGYVTVYGEDSPNVGSFHHQLPGFVEEPTDYYNRPYFLASDRLTGHRAEESAVGSLCQGERPSNTVIYNYSLASAEELKDVPYFGYFWTTALTHGSLQGAVRTDRSSLEYLKRLQDGGHLNNTVLFFVSDHGRRSGDFRITYAGMLEERLPFAHLVFPKWFRDKYHEATTNLVTNTRRLSSTFDLHATLRDILNQNYRQPENSPAKFKHGQSLFREIPANRTCPDASVPEHFCACEHTTSAEPDDPHLLAAADEALTQINFGLSVFPKCAVLRLQKILGGRVGSARKGTTPKLSETVVKSFIVTFMTEPGGGILEATVKLQSGEYELTAEVSRLNLYGNQSHCINDRTYRKYCYCKDLLT